MIDLMTTERVSQRHTMVMFRIYHAREVEALWYARVEMMAALSAERGEAFARQRVDALAPLFVGLMRETASEVAVRS